MGGVSAESRRACDGSMRRRMEGGERVCSGSGRDGCSARCIRQITRRHLRHDSLSSAPYLFEVNLDVPGSPEYAMRRCGLRTMILSSSTFIFMMDLAAVVSM